jgi:hypothetical protein
MSKKIKFRPFGLFFPAYWSFKQGVGHVKLGGTGTRLFYLTAGARNSIQAIIRVSLTI